MNLDVEARDKILFLDGYQPKKYIGGIRRFSGLTLGELYSLVTQDMIDPDDAQNDAPCVQEFMDFLEQHNGFTVHGYAVSPDRDDYRVSIEGCEKTDGVTKEDIIAFANRFRWASECTIEADWLNCWYD